MAGIQYEMSGFMEQCVERYLELAGVTADKLRPAATPGLDDHSFTEEDWQLPGELAAIAASVERGGTGAMATAQAPGQGARAS